MKNTTIILILLFTLVAQAQNFQLTPEFGINNPIGAYKQNNIAAKQGFGLGLHLDRQHIYKAFGLGLYLDYSKNESKFTTAFPTSINEAGFASEIVADINKLNWKTYQIALGPLVQFSLSEKIKLQLFSKAGLAKVAYPNYRYYADVTTPVQEQYTLFEANTPTDKQDNFNFMMLSGVKLNYFFNQRFGVSFGVNYTHIKGLTHTYTTREATFTQEMDAIQLFETLANTETRTATYRCNINSINATVGVVINLGGGNTNESIPEEVEETADNLEPQEAYECQSIHYKAPGYNDYVVLDKKPYTVFKWEDTNAKNLKKDTLYKLIFYIKENNQFVVVDERIMNSKKQFKIGLNPNKPYPDNALYWKIVPLNSQKESVCPNPRKMMRLLVFKTQQEANKTLPECKLIKE